MKTIISSILFLIFLVSCSTIDKQYVQRYSDKDLVKWICTCTGTNPNCNTFQMKDHAVRMQEATDREITNIKCDLENDYNESFMAFSYEQGGNECKVNGINHIQILDTCSDPKYNLDKTVKEEKDNNEIVLIGIG